MLVPSMIMERHEVIIIGAGPAGLRASYVLAEAGKDVLVLEKNNVIGAKPCAGGLTIKDLDIIPKKLVEKTFDHIILHTAKGLYEVNLGSHPVFMVSREKLGQWMAEEAEKAGAEIRTSCRVKDIKENHVVVDGRELGYDYLVGADGSNSILRKFLNIPVKKTLVGVQYISSTIRHELEVIVDDVKNSLKFGWVFPHRDFTSIGIGGWTKNAVMLKHSLDELCNNLCIEKTRFEAAHINFDYQGFAFGNRFLAGDAAGFSSGLTGEGIYQAILSGEEVAKGILNKNYKYPKIKLILNIKNRHERLLRIFSINSYIPHIVFNNALPILLRRRNLCRMINNKYHLV